MFFCFHTITMNNRTCKIFRTISVLPTEHAERLFALNGRIFRSESGPCMSELADVKWPLKAHFLRRDEQTSVREWRAGPGRGGECGGGVKNRARNDLLILLDLISVTPTI